MNNFAQASTMLNSEVKNNYGFDGAERTSTFTNGVLKNATLSQHTSMLHSSQEIVPDLRNMKVASSTFNFSE